MLCKVQIVCFLFECSWYQIYGISYYDGERHFKSVDIILQGIDDGQWQCHVRIETSVLGELKPVKTIKMITILMICDYIIPSNSS